MKRIIRFIPVTLALFPVLILAGAPLAFAYVASSSNYRIQSDSVNLGGGLSTSTAYTVQSTLGESGVGTSSSASFKLKGGYQQMDQAYLALVAPGNISLAPLIPSVGGGVANGSGVWTVTTDNALGYTLTLTAVASPALVSGVNSFADYVPAGAAPDFTFTTPAAAARFGFSPEGSDIVSRFKDNGAACNVGVLDTASACWDKTAITPTTIASRVSQNYPAGTATTIRFRAASGATNVQPGGSYTATGTVTVLAN